VYNLEVHTVATSNLPSPLWMSHHVKNRQ